LLAAEQHTKHDATAFVDGLLPEGDHRRSLAARADVKASDLFGLIARYGREIAGAVQFLPPEDEPTDCGENIEVLDATALNHLVDGLDDNPPAMTDESELSLPGLAPLYDQVPSVLFPKLQTDAAMSIGGGCTLNAIGRQAIEREAKLWNHDPTAAGEAATAVAAALVEAVEANVIDPQNPLAARITTAVDRS